ncbi:MAG: metalloregulator ArsR/SmtB family transcription factor [Pseudomonadota bacterium]
MDTVFKALSDPARRTLLDTLRTRDGQTLTELEAHLDMTRFGVMKHLKVLEEAGLVVSKKQGRFKYHYLNAVPLQEILNRWIEPLIAKPMAQGLTALKAQLEGTTAMADPASPGTADATDNANATKPDFVHQTFIRTSQDALWDALTKADQLGAHHFACTSAEGDAAIGKPTRMLRADGSTMLTQTAIALDPKTRIEKMFQPNWGEGEQQPSRIVFLISVEGPLCKLTCEHYDIPPGQEGVREGWARFTASLKSWLETGEALKMEM